jgi:hypothetical protein
MCNPYAEHDARWDDHFSDAVSERYAGEIIDGTLEAMADAGWQGTKAEFLADLARKDAAYEAAENARRTLLPAPVDDGLLF